jgi:Zn-dependent protease with chaperone function
MSVYHEPVYDGPVGGGRAVAFGDTGTVFVSTGDTALLDPPELAAILAHEDAHASVYNDGFLSVLAPLVAGCTFTGQNVLLGALNFRQRELRADDHAAAVTSSTQLVSALEQIYGALTEERATEGSAVDGAGITATSFTSFTPLDRDLTAFGRTFGFFYGGFTMTRAHPNVTTRLKRLRERKKNDDAVDRNSADM